MICKAVEASLKYETLANSPGVRNAMCALVVAEDRRFGRHPGIDWRGILRAIYMLMKKGKIEGASTIEQQLVRTIRGRYEFTIRRKLTEILLAMAVSWKYEKKLIAFSYLRLGYFGWRANGLIKVSERLGVDPQTLSRHEAAAIAAMLKLPMPRKPSGQYISRHMQRVDYIISNWTVAEGWNDFPF